MDFNSPFWISTRTFKLLTHTSQLVTGNSIMFYHIYHTKMLFWKHSIRTFECNFKRHKFDSVINSAILVPKLSSKQFFLKTNIIFVLISGEKYSSAWKQKSIWAHLISKILSTAQPWWAGLLGIHFRFFVPVS